MPVDGEYKYYVCFLDLLGQRDFFEEIKKDPNSPIVLNGVKKVTCAIESMLQYVSIRIEKDFGDAAGASVFSDSLVLWLRGDDKYRPWLKMLIKLVNIALRNYVPIRGAINLGEGRVNEKGEFIGLPLVEAMRAESSSAVYPRIILVGEMRKKLERQMDEEQKEDEYFRVDVDGNFVLDYFSRGILKSLEFQNEDRRIDAIVRWIKAKYCSFCFDVNSVSDFNSRKLDLAHKYVLWLDYASRAYGFPHHYLEELHDDVVEEVKCDDDFAGKIKEYVVIYLKIESPLLEVPGTYKLINSGSINEELSRTSAMIDVIQDVLEDLDCRLRKDVSYSGEMQSVKVTVQRLGDYFVVYAPLEKDIIRSMYALMILRNSWLFRLLGARGTFVRGAFAKGLGWEISSRDFKSTLYGPVMHKAYMLATKIAWKPRVVIDESIFKIVSDRSSFGPGKDGDWLPLSVRRDFDGVGYFNGSTANRRKSLCAAATRPNTAGRFWAPRCRAGTPPLPSRIRQGALQSISL